MKNRNKKLFARGLILILFLWTSFFAVVLSAEEKKGAGSVVEHSLESYIEYALRNNPAIKAAEKEIASQEKNLSLAISLPDPMIMAQADIEDGMNPASIGVSQMFMFPTKYLIRRYSESHVLKKLRARLQEKKADLIRDIRTAFIDLYKTGQMIKIQKQNLELLKQMESVTRTNYANATATQASLLKVQVEIAILEDEIRSMELMGESQRARMASLLALDSGSSFPFPDSIPDMKGILSIDDFFLDVANSNPSLQAMKSDIDAARSMVDMAKSGFLPDFSIAVEHMYESSNKFSSMGGESGWRVGVNINVPLWINRIRKEISSSTDMQKKMENQREDMLNSMLSEAKQMFNEYTDSQRRITLLKDVLIPQARQVLELMYSGYRTSLIPVIELLDAQRTLFDLEKDLAEERARNGKQLASIDAMRGKTEIKEL
ncbi:MAG TPA: TolC family protein [Chitinispirillaceae bacterium]|jgi:outer membrane protein TolC|nr:TolC family protein [Chitinispirillaceae bacterium]